MFYEVYSTVAYVKYGLQFAMDIMKNFLLWYIMKNFIIKYIKVFLIVELIMDNENEIYCYDHLGEICTWLWKYNFLEGFFFALRRQNPLVGW